MKGELSEKERPIVKSDLPVEVQVVETKMNLKGIVSNVSDITKETAAVQRKSTYPFMVDLQKGNEGTDTEESPIDQAHLVNEAQKSKPIAMKKTKLASDKNHKNRHKLSSNYYLVIMSI